MRYKSIINFDGKNLIDVDGLVFHKTCDAYPEQYDVYRGAKQVGYVRLRMGNLTVEVPDVGGELIYYKNYEKDPAKGYFYTQEERIGQLRRIAKILKRERTNANKRTRNK